MGKHDKMLAAIFREPIPANIRWGDVVALLESLGANATGVGGSVYRIELNGERARFHRPHPGDQCSRGLVRAIRAFLTRTGNAP